MSTSDGIQKRNAFTVCAAFRIESLEASLDREIAFQESWRPSATILKKHKDTWLKFVCALEEFSRAQGK
jgi:hypothetical protein